MHLLLIVALVPTARDVAFPSQVSDNIYDLDIDSDPFADAVPPIEQVSEPPPPQPPLLAQLGDRRQPRRPAPADTLSPASRPGALAGKGRARTVPEAMAGDDLDDMRFAPLNHLTRDTPSRIRTARQAVTYDNARATPNPRSRPQLVTGKHHGIQRTPDNTRPGRNSDTRRPVTPRRLATAPLEPGIGEMAAGDLRSGSPQQRAARDGSRRQARIRPDLTRGPPSTLTSNMRHDLADQRYREQASNRRKLDPMQAARASDSGDDSGRGQGQRAGRRGSVSGQERGRQVWIMTADRRYLPYLRKVHGKIQPLWSFPKELDLLVQQGDVLVRFTVLSDGKVGNVTVQKSSGFPSFDRVVVAAVRKAAPFDPLPRALGSRLEILAPFEFSNPMVR